ncbi:hypothetical protein UPYG_G00284550 [Umbra pygmaea]|uniref:Protein phosphatase 1 regulatory subunit n=1 Tax=Umbra pygmaea TaxID=75934 RepID=A0ABD0W4Q4_UMBPY
MLQTNCTSLFNVFPRKTTMPVELAMPLYLQNDDFCYRRTPKSLKPLRPCLKPYLMFQPSDPPQQTEPDEGNDRSKRRVSFADNRGLALTKLPDKEDRLVLDFTQPSSDYLLFRQRLETELVCLEHCMLKEKALAGTVKVKNLSFEKSVKVRVTFDSWKSYTDHECQYVKDTYTGSDRDTFSFEFSLPAELKPHKPVEFAICYEVHGKTYWDSNQGQNYRIVHSKLNREGQGSFCSNQKHLIDVGIHFDLYGSPRCSHGIFPEWPSYAGYENIGPYY